MDRAELLAEIDRRWHLIDDLAGTAGDEQLARRAGGPEAPPEGWTVGEVLLHMAGWKRRSLDIATWLAASPDQTESEVNSRIFGGWAAYNDGHKARAAGVGPDAVRAEHFAAHRELLAAIEQLPDACLLNEGHARGWLRPVLQHTFDHLEPDLRPALEPA